LIFFFSDIPIFPHVRYLRRVQRDFPTTKLSSSTQPGACESITRTLSYYRLIDQRRLAKVAMASGRDVRDMLGLPAAGGDAPKAVGPAAVAAQTQKRSKPAGGSRKIRTFGSPYVFPWEIVKRSRLTLIRPEGVAREVAALYGERPPPVAVYEEKKAYRAKRQSTGPAKRWYVRVRDLRKIG
jgi:hypothetical protein